MYKKITIIAASAFLFSYLMTPLQTAFAAAGGEGAEPSTFLLTSLTILSIATILLMIFYMIRE